MTTLTSADLTALGYRVVDGKAVRMAEGLDAAASKSERVRASSPATVLPRLPYRSKWEAERADIHEIQKRAGMIRDWRYEALRLKLADGAWYKADFLIVADDGMLWLEEVKGHWREAARVRWKVAVSSYPMFGFRVVSKLRGQWMTLEERCGGWLEVELPPDARGLRRGRKQRGAA